MSKLLFKEGEYSLAELIKLRGELHLHKKGFQYTWCYGSIFNSFFIDKFIYYVILLLGNNKNIKGEN